MPKATLGAAHSPTIHAQPAALSFHSCGTMLYGPPLSVSARAFTVAGQVPAWLAVTVLPLHEPHGHTLLYAFLVCACSCVAPDDAHSTRSVESRSAAVPAIAWPPLSICLYMYIGLVCILAESMPVSGPRCPLSAFALSPTSARVPSLGVLRPLLRPRGNAPITV